MRIVHASNFSLRKNGPFFYGVPYKLTNGLTRLGHFVFNFCDRDVADSYFGGIRRLGVGYANRVLIDVCDKVRPDLLLLGHCSIISKATLREIRQLVPGIKLAHWNCDALFIPRNFDRLYSLASVVDATFVTTAGNQLQALAKSGGRVAFMPNPVDTSIEMLRVFEKDRVENDLVFVTGTSRYSSEKARLCEFVRKRIPDLKFDVRGLFGRPGVYGADFFDVLGNSKMAINVSARNDIPMYSSDRMAQLIGCGLLTFVDRRTGFDSIFRDNELVFYESRDDLIDKLVYFKNNDAKRREMAARGCRRAHEIFSETLVAQWIVEATLRLEPFRAYAWPTEIHGERRNTLGLGKPGTTPELTTPGPSAALDVAA